MVYIYIYASWCDNKSHVIFLGQFPGPTIEARSGDRIILTVKNELPGNETTSIHFHGIRHLGSNAMDGATGVTQVRKQLLLFLKSM